MTMYQNYAEHYNIKIIKPRLWTNYSPLAESNISLVIRQKWLNHVYQQIFLRNNLIFWYFNWFNLNQRNKILYHLIKYLKTRISMSACLVAVIIQTLWDPMDYSPPDFSVHGILQARILEWVDISSSKGSSWPRDQIRTSCISWLQADFEILPTLVSWPEFNVCEALLSRSSRNLTWEFYLNLAL